MRRLVSLLAALSLSAASVAQAAEQAVVSGDSSNLTGTLCLLGAALVREIEKSGRQRRHNRKVDERLAAIEKHLGIGAEEKGQAA